MSTTLERYVAEVEERLANTDETTANPVLVMLTGLPGTGKSHVARLLSDVLPFVIIESDQVRKPLGSSYVPRPDGEAVEERRASDLRCH
jgi:adenylylsulfate kinase-like enzyme